MNANDLNRVTAVIRDQLLGSTRNFNDNGYLLMNSDTSENDKGRLDNYDYDKNERLQDMSPGSPVGYYMQPTLNTILGLGSTSTAGSMSTSSSMPTSRSMSISDSMSTSRSMSTSGSMSTPDMELVQQNRKSTENIPLNQEQVITSDNYIDDLQSTDQPQIEIMIIDTNRNVEKLNSFKDKININSSPEDTRPQLNALTTGHVLQVNSVPAAADLAGSEREVPAVYRPYANDAPSSEVQPYVITHAELAAAGRRVTSTSRVRDNSR